MDSAELLRLIRKELLGKLESPSQEWKTRKQWAEQWNFGASQTGRFITAALSAGLMEQRTFRVQCEGRACYPKPYYRIKETDGSGISKVPMKGFEKPE